MDSVCWHIAHHIIFINTTISSHGHVIPDEAPNAPDVQSRSERASMENYVTDTEAFVDDAEESEEECEADAEISEVTHVRDAADSLGSSILPSVYIEARHGPGDREMLSNMLSNIETGARFRRGPARKLMTSYGKWTLEMAKSGRSKCKGCDAAIASGFLPFLFFLAIFSLQSYVQSTSYFFHEKKRMSTTSLGSGWRNS